MSVLKEIELFQNLIKKDVPHVRDIDQFDEYDKLLKKWDKYRDFQGQFLHLGQSEEFLNLRKSINKISMPNLEVENDKLGKAIKNIHYDQNGNDSKCSNSEE